MNLAEAWRWTVHGARIAFTRNGDHLELNASQIRYRYVGRLIALFVFALSNAMLWLTTRGKPGINEAWLDGCMLYIEASIGIDFVLVLLFGRRMNRAYWPVVYVQFVLEVATLMVWIQATGLVTSYFVVAPCVLLVLMRFIFGYGVALVGVIAALTLYILAFALEDRGLIPSAPLLVDAAARARVSPGYRDLVLNFGIGVYVVSFVCANIARFGLVAKDRALEEANRKLRQAMDQARIGRLSGTRLGEYSIEDLLGRGGMGEVYAARAARGNKDVAIKLLHAHLGTDEKMRMRFRREAEVVGKMPAGTVAQVYQFGTTEEGYDYIVMERLRGEDLGALLKRRERLGLDEVVHLVERIAHGLDAAHAQGVVHRDLKPQNIFLCGELDTGESPDVRLLDFGVARLHEVAAAQTMTATAAVLGTPGYMPPEQASGGEVGPTVDIFALGAIAYRALTGKPAFPSRSPAGALFEALHHDPTPASEITPGLPRDVDAVLRIALAKSPAERYQRAGEMAADLAAAARGELSAAARGRAEVLHRASAGEADTMTGT